MKHFLILLFLAAFSRLTAQYRCSNHTVNAKLVSTCLHRNGTTSTREEWDADKRNGNLKIFNKSGVLLLDLNLRNYAGHASAQLSYHPNGQVSKVEYSSAPDAGIQFYKARYRYDEEGQQTEKWEEEHPYRLTIEPHFQKPDAPQRKDSPAAKCASPCFSVFDIRNLSSKKTRLWVSAKPNLYVSGKSREISLKAGETKRLDSLVYAERYLEPDQLYEMVLGEESAKKHRLVQVLPRQSGQTRYYLFLIIPE